MKIDIEKIKKLPPDVRKDFMKTFLQYQEKRKEGKIHSDFMAFVKHMWPEFIEGSHHKIVAEKFNQLAEGKLKRLIIHKRCKIKAALKIMIINLVLIPILIIYSFWFINS